jgi:hypothetical protein
VNAKAVPVPYADPPAVAVAVLFVPPFAIGRTPVTPVVRGRPVALVRRPAEGVPIFGVVSVGLACMTNVEPVPVWAATEVALPTDVIGPVKLALVITVAALPTDVTPPVRFALVTTVATWLPFPGPAVTIPVSWVMPVSTSGGVAQTPSPRQNVEADAEVPLFRLPTGRFPVIPVVKGKPVTLVITPEAGVPKSGVVKTGLVNVLLVSVCVPVNVTTVESIEIVPVEVIGPPVSPVPVATEVTPVPVVIAPQALLA